jgi:hypothetical protein
MTHAFKNGLKRSAITNIIFCREYENKSEWNSVEKVWFSQKMHYSLRTDMGENLAKI